MNEVVDVSFTSCEDQFDKMLGKLQLEQPCHGKQITKKFEGCHDPIVEYVEKLGSDNGWLCLCSKDQFLYLSHVLHESNKESLTTMDR